MCNDVFKKGDYISGIGEDKMFGKGLDVAIIDKVYGNGMVEITILKHNILDIDGMTYFFSPWEVGMLFEKYSDELQEILKKRFE